MNIKYGKIENLLLRNKIRCPRCDYDMGKKAELYKDNLGIYAKCPICDAEFNKTIFIIENSEEQLRNSDNKVFAFTSYKSA